jgi:hypothetical protein
MSRKNEHTQHEQGRTVTKTKAHGLRHRNIETKAHGLRHRNIGSRGEQQATSGSRAPTHIATVGIKPPCGGRGREAHRELRGAENKT